MELLTKLIAEMRLDARIMLYWHGTTDLNVNTILSQGLSQGIGPDVWGETEAPPLPTNQDTSSMSNYRYDLNQHIYDELRRSYGGRILLSAGPLHLSMLEGHVVVEGLHFLSQLT